MSRRSAEDVLAPCLDGVDLLRRHRKVDGDAQGDAEHEQRQEDPQLLGLQPLAEPDAVLRADHAADHQRQPSIRSTLWFCQDCITVVNAVTNMICMTLVPITTRVGMRSR